MIDRVLGAEVVVRVAAPPNAHRLRVLAYHGVDDPGRFAEQVGYLVDHWNPVTANEVVEACRGGEPLPPRAVWLTFDDGLRSTVTAGRAVLDRFGVEGTVFVNPGVVGSPQWWHLVEEADGVEAVRAAKQVSDDERRRRVAAAAASLSDATRARLGESVASWEELGAWVAAGHQIGNHTWDHPCLDRCDAGAQVDQVDRGRRALADAGLSSGRLFAYPNGDWAPAVDEHLRSECYDLGLLFDHRLATIDDPMMLSRLRVDASAALSRFRAILSGVHPALMHLRDRVRAQSS